MGASIRGVGVCLVGLLFEICIVDASIFAAVRSRCLCWGGLAVWRHWVVCRLARDCGVGWCLVLVWCRGGVDVGVL